MAIRRTPFGTEYVRGQFEELAPLIAQQQIAAADRASREALLQQQLAAQSREAERQRQFEGGQFEKRFGLDRRRFGLDERRFGHEAGMEEKGHALDIRRQGFVEESGKKAAERDRERVLIEQAREEREAKHQEWERDYKGANQAFSQWVTIEQLDREAERFAESRDRWESEFDMKKDLNDAQVDVMLKDLQKKKLEVQELERTAITPEQGRKLRELRMQAAEDEGKLRAAKAAIEEQKRGALTTPDAQGRTPIQRQVEAETATAEERARGAKMENDYKQAALSVNVSETEAESFNETAAKPLAEDIKEWGQGIDKFHIESNRTLFPNLDEKRVAKIWEDVQTKENLIRLRLRNLQETRGYTDAQMRELLKTAPPIRKLFEGSGKQLAAYYAGLRLSPEEKLARLKNLNRVQGQWNAIVQAEFPGEPAE